MRIGVVCNCFQKSGGMESYTLDIVEEFLKVGHEVVIFTKKYDSSLPLASKVQIYVNKLTCIPHKIDDIFFSKWINKKKKKLNLDIVFGCCRNSASDVILCGGTNIGYLRAINKENKGLLNKIRTSFERKTYNDVKCIVAHSKLVKNELVNLYGVNPDKIHVIYPPVNSEKFHPVSNDDTLKLREKYNLDKDKVYFLFPSSGHERKGLPFLMDYFSKTDKNTELLVVGRSLENPCKNIRSLGYVSNIEELYQACDYSILASSYEPFGLIGIESVLCGTPTVLADNIGCCEVLKEPAVNKFSRKDKDSFAKLMDNLCSLKNVNTNNLINKDFISYDLSVKEHVQKLLSI